MKVIESTEEIQRIIDEHKAEGDSIGFVPTMGALHEGHISLVRRAGKENDISILSIFVNPTQFNSKTDLEKYPRNIEEDQRQLKYEKVDYIFAPKTEDIYPEKKTKEYDFGNLNKVMEGKYREGHFNGVAQIVSILFELIPAHKAYFGRKDFQQIAIIKHLVDKYMPKCEIQIIECPTVREKDGLAMSSRNTHLTKSHRIAAPIIYETLTFYRNKVHTLSPKEIIEEVTKKINAHPLLEVEYFEIVHDKTLDTADKIIHNQTSGCIAVHAGKVRLIDNISF